MGELLAELEQILRSKQYVLTAQESKAMLNCKSKAIKSYAYGAIFGAGVSWFATSKLSLFGRISISAGASTFMGLWRFGNSLDSSVDHILTLEGSRMQLELAKLVVMKYKHDTRRMKHVAKLFYSEEVFDDSTSNQPKIRWRSRNFFSDNVDNGQRTQESDSYGDSHIESHGVDYSEAQSGSNVAHMESDRTKFNPEPKQTGMNAAVDTMDPIDCCFGYPEMEEIRHHDPSTTPAKIHSRKERRAHRRRRLRHPDSLLSPQPAA